MPLAMLAGLAAQGAMAWYGGKKSRDMAKKAAEAAQQAAAAREEAQRKGLAEQEKGFNEGISYLEPYRDTGSQNLLYDILGINGPEAQSAALQKYEGSPSANILRDVLSETARTTGGEFAAQGLHGSGAHEEELTRRLADRRLADYGRYQGLVENTAGRSQNAAVGTAELAARRGGALAATHSQIGDTQAAGFLGPAYAQNQGTQASLNYLAPVAGAVGQLDMSFLDRGGQSGMPIGAPTRGAPTPGANDLGWLTYGQYAR